MISRVVLSCLDADGVVRRFFPLADEEAADFISMLWRRGSGTTQIASVKLRSSDASWRWASFFRDGKLYRRIQLPAVSLPGLWAMAWAVRGKAKQRNYWMDLEPTAADSWIFRRKPTKGRAGPPLEEMPF